MIASNAEIIAELARARCVFQLRAIAAAIGWPSGTAPEGGPATVGLSPTMALKGVVNTGEGSTDAAPFARFVPRLHAEPTGTNRKDHLRAR